MAKKLTQYTRRSDKSQKISNQELLKSRKVMDDSIVWDSQESWTAEDHSQTSGSVTHKEIDIDILLDEV